MFKFLCGLIVISQIPISLASDINFGVYASSESGKAFYNNADASVVYDFKASGRWTINPDTGYHGPAGRLSKPICNPPCKLDGATVGALVMQRADGEFIEIGEILRIALKKNEKVLFFINDTNGRYSDNRGKVTVKAQTSN